MRKENIAIGISVLSLILGIISICIAAWRSPELSFDYQGVIVGALSILVTVLIGWNIYTLIDIKNMRDKIEGIASGASRMTQKTISLSEYSSWQIYHYLLLQKDPLGLEFRFLYHGISCLLHTSKIGDIATCNSIVRGMLDCIVNPENIMLLESNKKRLLGLLAAVEHPDKIDGYLELLRRVALIRERV